MGLQANLDKPGCKILDGSLGYSGFKWLREDLALNVGYEYKTCKPDNPNNLYGKTILCWSDETYNPVLNKFFLVPDDDFSLSPDECRALYSKFKNVNIQESNKNRYDTFMNWLKQAIDNDSVLEVG